MATCVAPTSASALEGAYRRAALERQIVDQINVLRARRGLPNVVINANLRKGALGHTVSMARHGYFTHDSRDGTAWDQRVLRHYRRSPASSWSIGENMLWAAAEIDGRDAIAMWMASPSHRAILIDPEWHEVGVGALIVKHAPGEFEGLDVAIVVADFGDRKP